MTAPPGSPPVTNPSTLRTTRSGANRPGDAMADAGHTEAVICDSSFPDIPTEFPTVFDVRIRVMPGEHFKIHLKDDAVPFCATSPRRVALSLREPLKEELRKLESEGIITAIKEPTEWCANRSRAEEGRRNPALCRLVTPQQVCLEGAVPVSDAAGGGCFHHRVQSKVVYCVRRSEGLSPVPPG